MGHRQHLPVIWEIGVREVLVGLHDPHDAPRRRRERRWIEGTIAAFDRAT